MSEKGRDVELELERQEEENEDLILLNNNNNNSDAAAATSNVTEIEENNEDDIMPAEEQHDIRKPRKKKKNRDVAKKYSASVLSLLIPVSIAMLLVVWAVKNLSPLLEGMPVQRYKQIRVYNFILVC